MRKNGLIIGYVVLVCAIFTYANFAQKLEQVTDGDAAADFSFNDRLVLHAMRTIHSAQLTYIAAYGNGNFAHTLPPLQQAGLIDESLASGQKYGYRFVLSYRIATVTTMAGYELKVIPVETRTRQLSFYMNDSCDIRGSESNRHSPSISDPIIEPCGTSLRSLNEQAIIGALREIRSAQITYQSSTGRFGTLTELRNANLITSGFAYGSITRGYSGHLVLNDPGFPPSFEFSAVPQEYGRTGVRSFFIDETGVLRGADKHGLPADENDPPIVD
jgi:hypothetical protein